MKSTILIALSLFSATGVSQASAWNVSSEPELRNVLIEEFTGIHCPNCPDGQRVVNELKALHPERFFSVAIHAGYYATPGMGEPDYTTNIGNVLGNHFQPSFFPCAVVNRLKVEDSFIQSRSDWGPMARGIVDRISPVNLWIESSYNCATRTMTVNVEGYMAEDIADPRLNIFLLQSEVLGPQAGGQKEDKYPHRHMLRDRVTSEDFGETLEAKKGEYFSKTYTYAVPEDFWDVKVEPEHLSLLCFVTDGEDNVCQVTESRPVLSEPVQFSIADCTAPLIGIGKNYAFDFVEAYIHNYGNVPVTSADFNVKLDKETFSYTWTGSVEPYSSSLVRIPLEGRWQDTYDKEKNQYAIRMMKANGTEVDTRSISGTFNELFTYPTELNFTIKTDLNAGDNTYRIIDREGNTVKEFGPYPEGEDKEYTESVTLEDGKIYGLEITDAWGDGIRHPTGFVKIFNKEGKSVAQLREINGYGLRQFFRASADMAGAGLIEDPEVINTEMYDLSGRRVDSETAASGIYIIRQHLGDGTVKVVKKTVTR